MWKKLLSESEETYERNLEWNRKEVERNLEKKRNCEKMYERKRERNLWHKLKRNWTKTVRESMK